MLNSLVPWLIIVVLRSMKRKDGVSIIAIIKIFCKMIQMKVLALSGFSYTNVMENAVRNGFKNMKSFIMI